MKPAVRPFTAVALAFSLAAGASTQDAPPRAPAGIEPVLSRPRVRNEFLVRFRAGVGDERRNAVIAAAGADLAAVARARHPDPASRVYALRLRGSPDEAAVLRRLAADPDVASAHPNYLYQTCDTLPDDPRFPELWGLRNTGQTGGTPGADIRAAAAWDLTTGSSSIVVAVLDTGVRLSHQDLTDNRWINPGEVGGTAGVDDDGNGRVDDLNGWDFLDNDNDPFDGDGHGTHMAGTIGARGNNLKGVTGVCWDVKIMALRFIGSAGGADLDAIQALDYATDLKLNHGINLVAINCSWTNDAFSPTLYDAVRDAQDAGILVVCAAGNTGSSNDLAPVYPASFDLPGVLSVAASDHDDRMADLSCFGPVSVDLFAPGVNIRSTFIPLDNVYATRTGSSMAAAHVSGAIGLLAALRPAETAARRRARLLCNVDRKDFLSGRVASCGRLNVFRALQDDETLPPDAVTTLAASDPSYSGVTLSWTATGDDASTGRAAAIDVRFSTSPITAAGFDSAARVPCPPLPVDSGTPQSMRVGGLQSATTYHFAMKVIDNLGNESALSNPASLTTLPASTATAFLSDDFEAGGAGAPVDPARWTAPAPWGKADLSGSLRAADSPSGLYAANLDLPLTSAVFNLAGKRDATLSFTHQHVIEPGKDFGFVEISRDAGATWEWVTQVSGTLGVFAPVTRAPLPGLDGVPTARLRFRLRSDGGGNLDGWNLDDILVLADSMGTNGRPAAQPQSVTTLWNTPVSLVLAGSDPEGDPLTFALGPGPSDGVLSGTPPGLVYTPSPGFIGPDSFQFTVSDGTDSSAPATVSLTVNPPGSPPTANSSSAAVGVNSAVSITLSGSDPDGDPLTFAIASPPANGTLSGAPPDVVYTPSPGYAGPDLFTFTAFDGTRTSAPATVSIQVGSSSGGGGRCGQTGLEALAFLALVLALRRTRVKRLRPQGAAAILLRR